MRRPHRRTLEYNYVARAFLSEKAGSRPRAGSQPVPGSSGNHSQTSLKAPFVLDGGCRAFPLPHPPTPALSVSCSLPPRLSLSSVWSSSSRLSSLFHSGVSPRCNPCPTPTLRSHPLTFFLRERALSVPVQGTLPSPPTPCSSPLPWPRLPHPIITIPFGNYS